MSEADKAILKRLFQKVNELDNKDNEIILLCCAAYAAGKVEGEKKAAPVA